MKPDFNFEQTGKNPFEVPNGYFEDFAQRIEQSIEQKAVAPKRIPLFAKTKPYLAAAAMIFAIFTIGTIFFNNYSTKQNTADIQPVVAYDEATNQMLLEEISESDMIDYLIANTK